MLALYRACPIGLIEGEAYGTELLAAPERLASLFMLSVAQFSRYVNVAEEFHEGLKAPAFELHHGVTLERGVDVAKRLSDGCFESAHGADVPGFRYLDRELDVSRPSARWCSASCSPRRMTEGRSWSRSRSARTPMRSTRSSRRWRLRCTWSLRPNGSALGRSTAVLGLTIPRRPPYADVGVLLIGPQKGKRINVLAIAKALGSALEQSAAFGSLIGRIHFLQGTDDGQGSIAMDRA
jgi:hypothetical protein